MKFRKLFILFVLVCVAYATVATVDAVAERVDNLLGNTVVNGNITVKGDVKSADGDYKYAYMPICAYNDGSGVRTDSFTMCGLARNLTANGLESESTVEAGSTEGFVTMNDSTDYILFYATVPELYFDSDTAADLKLEFDLSEGAAATGTDSYVITFYQDGSETAAMLTDNVSMSGTARAWASSSGLGDNASISGNCQSLIVKVAPSTSNDDMRVYGARWNYRPGVDQV